mgnify:CR=1 FL=1
MISIYKNYDTSSLVLDKPCVVDGIGAFYPVRVKDYIEMQEYGSFLIYNKKYFGLNPASNSFPCVSKYISSFASPV